MTHTEPASTWSRPPVSCEARGYCGPFVGEDVYNSVPGWQGIANCARCGNTVTVARHLARQDAMRERFRGPVAGSSG